METVRSGHGRSPERAGYCKPKKRLRAKVVTDASSGPHEIFASSHGEPIEETRIGLVDQLFI
jgi:hypothetical protein